MPKQVCCVVGKSKAKPASLWVLGLDEDGAALLWVLELGLQHWAWDPQHLPPTTPRQGPSSPGKAHEQHFGGCVVWSLVIQLNPCKGRVWAPCWIWPLFRQGWKVSGIHRPLRHGVRPDHCLSGCLLSCFWLPSPCLRSRTCHHPHQPYLWP